MSCGCNNKNMKQDLNWSLERAKQIVQIREEDMQVYKTFNSTWGVYYEIEPVNPGRKQIIQIITCQEKE